MDPTKRLSSLVKKSKFAPKNPFKTGTSRLPSKPSDAKRDKKSGNLERKPSTSDSKLNGNVVKSNTPTDSNKCGCEEGESVEQEDGRVVCGSCGMVLAVQQMVNTVAFEEGEGGSSRLMAKIVVDGQ